MLHGYLLLFIIYRPVKEIFSKLEQMPNFLPFLSVNLCTYVATCKMQNNLHSVFIFLRAITQCQHNYFRRGRYLFDNNDDRAKTLGDSKPKHHRIYMFTENKVKSHKVTI